MSTPETCRDYGLGPKEWPKKIWGPNVGAKEPGPFFLDFALCNFHSPLQWISFFSCGEYISVSMRYMVTSVIWKLGRIQPRIQILCLLCWQPLLVLLTQPLNAISAPIRYLSQYITSNWGRILQPNIFIDYTTTLVAIMQPQVPITTSGDTHATS